MASMKPRKDVAIINCNIGAIYRKRIEALAQSYDGTITKALKLIIVSCGNESLMLSEADEFALQYEEDNATGLDKTPRNINCKITQTLHDKLHNFAKRRRLTLSTAVRLLIDYDYCRAAKDGRVIAGFPEVEKEPSAKERTKDMFDHV